jgi:hypothetical protein
MDKIFASDFWEAQAAVVMQAPWAIVPLLLLAGFIGSKIQNALNGREIRGLKAENNALKQQLNLAHDKQGPVTKQVEILEGAETGKVPEWVTEVKRDVTGMLPEIVEKAVAARLDKIATTSAVVANTVTVLSTANNALGASLNPSGAIYSDTPLPLKATKGSV